MALLSIQGLVNNLCLKILLFRIEGSLRFLFWNLFGLSELEDLKTEENFIITQYTGELLLGLYSIASVIVAINMLIAMMANSYQRVAVSFRVTKCNFN